MIHLHYRLVFILAVMFAQIPWREFHKDSNAVVTCFQAVEAIGCDGVETAGCDCVPRLDLELDLEDDEEVVV
jgi:hypothetical protein